MGERGLPLIYVVLMLLFLIFAGLFLFDQFTGNTLLSFELGYGLENNGISIGILLLISFFIIVLLILRYVRGN